MAEVKVKPKRGWLWKTALTIITIYIVRNFIGGEAPQVAPAPTVTSVVASVIGASVTLTPTPISTATLLPTNTVTATDVPFPTVTPVVLGVDNSEYAALAVFFASTRGESWVNSDGWLEGSPCEWYGITCKDNHVVTITLPDNNLDGALSSALGDLSHLTFLELNRNNLSGSLPSSLGNLSSLEWLGLSNNPELSGNIPSEFANLLNLKTLSLRNNQMSGELPISLTSLDLDRLWIEGSNLCAPADVAFQEWLVGIDDSIVITCE